MTLRGEDDIEDKDRRAMRLWKKPPPSSIRQYRTFLLCNLLTILSHGANPLLSRIQTTTAYQFKFRRRQHLGNAPLIMPTASVFGKNQSTPSSALSSATSDDELSVERPSSSKVDIARNISPTVWIQQLKVGYERRVAADPRFGSKSITEVILAATTQLMAEWNRRGADRLLPEFDFVFPAILAAVFGKYYSMWRVARTLDDSTSHTDSNAARAGSKESSKDVLLFGRMKVPTNAFQQYLLDGYTQPTFLQRIGSFVAPVWPLFRAGMISSAVGYGIGAILVQIRSVLVPDFVPVTVQVNIVHACLYTGCFLAIVSNIRYQILQGLVEPFIDKVFAKFPLIRSLVIFVIRYLNGLLGSILAISGMRFFGLQKLK